jgi:hypothetical protein
MDTSISRYEDFQARHGRYNNPDFYRQLGKDPEQLMATALELLAKKFRL